MYELLKIIIFGSAIWVTPQPIDLYSNEPIFMFVNISAINDNASFSLDVTDLIEIKSNSLDYNKRGFAEFFDGYDVFVDAYYEDGLVRFYYNGDFSYNYQFIRMSLRAEESVVGKKFKKIKLVSNKRLSGVKLLWSNSSL